MAIRNPNNPSQTSANTNVYTDSGGGGAFGTDAYYGYGSGRIKGQNIVRSGTQSNDPYRTGLNNNFVGRWDVPHGQSFYDYSNDSDPDVREAQRLANENSAAHHGIDQGVDSGVNNAKMAALQARIGLKNSLGGAIHQNAGLENQAEADVTSSANSALGEGLRNTRQNYNSRGLLYSGMREAGEQTVRGEAAGQEASGLASTKRDYSNLLNSQQQAYANIGLQQQQLALDNANQAFDVVSRNSIARLQAYQTLAGGVGRAAGYIAGSSHKQTQTETPSDGGYSSSYDPYGNQPRIVENF